MAFSAEQLNIIIAARTQDLQRDLKNAERRVSGFERQSRRSLSQTSRHFDALGSAARRLVPVLTAAFSVQAGVNMVRSAAEIGRLAQVAGTGVVEFQRFAAAAKTTGIDMSNASDVIKDVNDKIGDFLQTGGGPMADFFENIAPKVGVTADQFARLSGPEALKLYVKSLQAANLTQGEMTFYMEALANDATALLPILVDNGSEMRRLGDEAQRAGRILDEDAVDGARELEEEVSELSETIKTALTEAIIDNKDELLALVDFITGTAIPAFGDLIGAITRGVELYNAARGIDTGDFGAQPSEEEAARRRADIEAAMGGGDPSATGTRFYNRETGQIEEFGPDTPSIPGVTAPSEEFISAESTRHTDAKRKKRAKRDIRDEFADLMKRIELEHQLLGASNARKQVLKAIANSDKKYTDDAIDGAVSRIEAYEAEKQAMERIQAEQQAIADTLQSSMESAFMSIVDGTKSAEDAFKDMARQIIMELYRVLVVQRLVGSFEQGGGGILGSVFSAFGGGSPGAASGRSVQANRPYTVGEHGRELFVPSSAGRVLSVSQAKAAVGGGGTGQQVVVNYSFQGGVTEADLGRALPVLVERTKREVVDAVQRGGSVARVFR